MARRILEFFAQGIAGTNDTDMFKVASVHDLIDPRGPPAITVTMRDERHGYFRINKLKAVDEEVCITLRVYRPLTSGFTSCPCGIEIAGEKNAWISCNAPSFYCVLLDLVTLCDLRS